eukprot:TRINITY_DN95925_c0_g1_i1.p1 TRINITY_DN95925_c0_g1~~TRINITY_DN95925_c0_g1_i1.p1  ORF type:complete len:279 (-),score=47.22 TRINITY_DN95925_c0_g1_i1:63-872(-)
MAQEPQPQKEPSTSSASLGQGSSTAHPRQCSGAWCGRVSGDEEQWVLAVDSEGLPGAFGAAPEGDVAGPSLGLSLLRGFVTSCSSDDASSADRRIKLRRTIGMSEDGRKFLEMHLGLFQENGDKRSIRTIGDGIAKVDLRPCESYAPLKLHDLPGYYRHSKGGVVEITEENGNLIVQNPHVRARGRPQLIAQVLDGRVQFQGHLGRKRADANRIEWSNGSVWTKDSAASPNPAASPVPAPSSSTTRLRGCTLRGVVSPAAANGGYNSTA